MTKTGNVQMTGDISLIMYSVFTTGVFIWLVYGVIIMDAPLIAANSITFLLAFAVLMLKIKHG